MEGFDTKSSEDTVPLQRANTPSHLMIFLRASEKTVNLNTFTTLKISKNSGIANKALEYLNLENFSYLNVAFQFHR